MIKRKDFLNFHHSKAKIVTSFNTILNRSFVTPLLGGAVTGTVLAISWLVPGSTVCAALGWLFAVLICAGVHKSPRPYLFAYSAGLSSNTIAFFWLLFTIAHFGGFGIFPASLVFALFVTISSLQYVLFILFYRRLWQSLDQFGLRLALAWVAAEFCSLRIFPWYLGHTQLGFESLAQIADIAGAKGISFLMFLVCESMLLFGCKSASRNRMVPALALFIGLIFYGNHQLNYFELLQETADKQSFAIIQANISLDEKHGQNSLGASAQRHLEISNTLLAGMNPQEPTPLIIWPETAIVNWIHSGAPTVYSDPFLPRLNLPAPMLFGALTYDDPQRLYNSALALLPNGKVLEPYHKQILMPFGEYTPLGDYLPFLKDLNSTAGGFVPGNQVKVFEYTGINSALGSKAVRLSPLICYEDVVSEIARQATVQGAELLVNMSNDGWFGDSVAPYQHHLIASFRAIENRRVLIRSTNSGYTAIVTPTGKTASHIQPFSIGTILAKLSLISYKSIYTNYVGDKPYWCILILSLFALLCRQKDRHKKCS